MRNAAHYGSAAPVGRHLLRVRPRNGPGQTVLESALDIEPTPAERLDGFDYFGNPTTWVSIEGPHERFVVRSTATVEVNAAARPDAALTPPWEVVREEAMRLCDLGPTAPAHFVFPSRVVHLDRDISAFAAASFSPGVPILSAAIDLMQRLHAEMTFDAEATDVTTRE
jgi:transglutaminase-like putative cysteine protease